MPQMIIGVMLKKFLPKILGIFILMLLGITASIWFLDGWAAFFTSVGVIVLSVLAVPVIVILSLVTMLKVGKQLKQFLSRKKTKAEFMSDVIQALGMYMMGEQMSAIFSGMSAEDNKKVNKENDIIDVTDKSTEKSNSNFTTVLGGAVGTDLLLAEKEDTDINNKDPMAAMMQMMSDPEVQAQMEEMMKIMMSSASEEIGDKEFNLSMLMNTTTFLDENSKEKNNNDIEDVEIKK